MTLKKLESLENLAQATINFLATCDDHPIWGMTPEQSELWDDMAKAAEEVENAWGNR